MQVLGFACLYAGKMAAALSRRHPRDLLDVGLLLEDEQPEFGLVGLAHAADFPGVRRNLRNLAQRTAAKRF